MDELKPCPFCNGEMMLRGALWPSEGDRDAIIHKESNKCGFYAFEIDTFDDGKSVSEAWNRRAALDAKDARIAELEQELRDAHGEIAFLREPSDADVSFAHAVDALAEANRKIERLRDRFDKIKKNTENPTPTTMPDRHVLDWVNGQSRAALAETEAPEPASL